MYLKKLYAQGVSLPHIFCELPRERSVPEQNFNQQHRSVFRKEHKVSCCLANNETPHRFSIYRVVHHQWYTWHLHIPYKKIEQFCSLIFFCRLLRFRNHWQEWSSFAFVACSLFHHERWTNNPMKIFSNVMVQFFRTNVREYLLSHRWWATLCVLADRRISHLLSGWWNKNSINIPGVIDEIHWRWKNCWKNAQSTIWKRLYQSSCCMIELNFHLNKLSVKVNTVEKEEKWNEMNFWC